MTQTLKPSGTKRPFYGWIALTGVLLVAFVVGGAFFYSYGVFLPAMCAEFGWSRAVVSGGMMMGALAFALPGPLTGTLIVRFGPRVNMVLGSLLAAMGMAGMSLVQEVWHVYLVYGIAGLGAGVAGSLACITVANNWFARRRSLAMGAFTAAAGLGGFTFPAIDAILISSIGWRMSWLVLAGLLFVVGGLIGGLILVRNRPEDMGQTPDGIPFEPFEQTGMMSSLSGAGSRQEGWQTGQALRSSDFWLLATFGAANFFVMGAMVGHQVAYIQGLGFSPVVAALTMSMIPGVGIIGRLGFGILALRFSMKSLVISCFVMQLIALLILLTTKNLTLIYIYAALLGISSGALITATPAFNGAYFGPSHFAQIQGILFAFGITAFAVAPVIAGIIYDAAATYSPVFAIAIACSLVGLVCATLTRQPKLLQPGG